jgi:hypothetical protein
LLTRRPGVTADFSPELNYRLMHLGFYVLFQNHLAIGQNLLNVRAQFASLRVDDLKFFLYAESKYVIANAVAGVR